MGVQPTWRNMLLPESRSKMTHNVIWLRDFGATQHVERAAIPTYRDRSTICT